jgi:HlyD family secretion protein
MEKQNARKELKKVVIRFAVVFVIVLMVLTFFSKTVEQILLPQVTTYIPKDKTVTNTYKFKGKVIYKNKKMEYPAFDYYIADWLIREGTPLEVGTPIATLRQQDVEERRSQYEIQRIALEDRIAGYDYQLDRSMGKHQKESVERQLKIAKIEYEHLISEIDQYFRSIDKDYQLLSEVTGKVTNIPLDDHKIFTISMPLFEYVDNTSYPVIEWFMHPNTMRTFNSTSKIMLDYTYLEANANGVQFEKADIKYTNVDKVRYDPESKQYIYMTILPRNDEKLITSRDINVSVIAKTKRLYNAVPKSALYNEDTIFLLSSDEETGHLIVKELGVSIVQETDTHVKLDYTFSQNDKVIISTTKPLTHNARVKLR